MADEFQLDEISILGNILNDNQDRDALLNASQRLVPEDFSDVRNREIYRACISLNQKGMSVDLATIIEELKNTKMYEAVGGEEYLQEILDRTVRIARVDTYIKSVQDKSLLNRYLNQLDRILTDARNNPIKDVSEFIGAASDKIIEISQQRSVAEAKDMPSIADNVVARLVKQTEEFQKNGIRPNGVTGIETGYEALDKLTKGWHKGDMIVVGARPSVGKTAFALNLLYKVAAKKKGAVVFFSLEMSAESIAMRLLSLTSQLSTDEINSLQFKPGSTKKTLLIETHSTEETANAHNLQRGLDELVSLPFYIDDNPGSTMMDISTKCKKLQNQIREIKHEEIALIAIDYLGLISSPSTYKGGADSRQQQVADISRQIKQLARTLEVPIVALTQLSRDSEKRQDHTPQMSDIRESGAIEQDADMVMMLYRSDYYNKVNTEGGNDGQAKDMVENEPISPVSINLIKNRNGQTGGIRFIFDKPHCSFNVATDDDSMEEY